MSRLSPLFLPSILVALLLITFFNSAIANENRKHSLAIQVSMDDLRTQKITMNTAVNLQKL